MSYSGMTPKYPPSYYTNDDVNSRVVLAPASAEYYPSHGRNESGVTIGEPYIDPMAQGITRLPSPTPSEEEALTGGFNIRKYLNPSFLFSKKGFPFLILGIVIIGSVIAFTFFDKQIVTALQPAANWVRSQKLGFLIPIAALVILSFPPLVGAEIVHMLTGITYGLGIGFLIVCAGTILGECTTFFFFKYVCKGRAKKSQKTSISFASLSRVVQEGGFLVVLIVRYSIIPPHFATAVFATAGVGFFKFLAAAILSLPKQFLTVYIGTELEDEINGTDTKKSKLVNIVVFAITAVVTVFAMRYINGLQRRATEEIVFERRRARQNLPSGSVSRYDNSTDV